MSTTVDNDTTPANDRVLPTYALSHGGGPWPWMKDMMPGIDWGPLERSLTGIPGEIGVTPRAVVMVSAHWETPRFTVQTHPRPPMVYDYYGFPPHTYEIEYPAPGDPGVAEEVAELLEGVGLPVDRDPERGFDHGMYTAAYPLYPEADVPVVQLSIRADFDPEVHLAAGRALRPLRSRGILLLGSGVPTYHDLSSFGQERARVASGEFEAWLTETMVGHVGSARSERLARWYDAPSAKACHPRPDHFVPLLVAAGAAEEEAGSRHYHQAENMMSVVSSAYRLGA